MEGALGKLHKRLGASPISTADCQTDLDKARERTAFLGKVVKNLKGYAQELDCEFRSERLAGIVAEARGLVIDELEESGRSVRGVEVSDLTPERISLDASRHLLVQAFENVIKNAFEALDDGGRIEIDAKPVYPAHARKHIARRPL